MIFLIREVAMRTNFQSMKLSAWQSSSCLVCSRSQSRRSPWYLKNHSTTPTCLDGNIPLAWRSGTEMRVESENYAFLASNWGDSRFVAQIKLEGEGETMIGYRAFDWNSFKVIIGQDYVIAQRERDQEISELDGVGGVPIPRQEWFQLELLV